MVLINYATKEIVAKIVYYGPGLCGKTTNLQQVFAKLNPKKRGKMISLATEADRTLFFDFLPMELGMVQGFKVRFQLYTVPGQVFYGATRKLVLKGADAVVFVADSQSDVLGKNVESLEDMKENLIENNLDPDVIPIVFQYNKRDLENVLAVEVLERELNRRGAPYFAASAINGAGVMETFKEVTRLLLHNLKAKHSFMDTDKLRDLPAEVFEYKAETPAEAKPVEYELELGSAIRDEGPAEEVIAGELLDQMESISLADSVQAETFFDVVRKGASTEEAVQKAEMTAVQPEPDQPSGSLLSEMGDFREREIAPEELDFVSPGPEMPSSPQGGKPPVEEYMGLDMTSPEMMEQDYMTSPQGPVSAAPIETPMPPPAPPVDIFPSAAPSETPMPTSAQPVDISPVVLALERLELQVAALGGEVEELRRAVSVLSSAPATSAMPAPIVPPGIAKQLDELSRGLKDAMEGQDRLLLSILESVRESKKSSANASEKLEDALKYIIDKLRDTAKDEGKGGKKKWF